MQINKKKVRNQHQELTGALDDAPGEYGQPVVALVKK
jgi:hypothetical protein